MRKQPATLVESPTTLEIALFHVRIRMPVNAKPGWVTERGKVIRPNSVKRGKYKKIPNTDQTKCAGMI
jgi:hypothetical protein